MTPQVVFKYSAEGDEFDRTSLAEAPALIDAYSGRQIGGYILGTVVPATRRRSGSEGAYVACARGSIMRGFVVRIER